MLKNFLRGDEGQDLIEYTLLLAFVCLVGAALFIPVGDTVAGTWSTTGSVVSKANSAAAEALQTTPSGS
ncbi:MAG: Flp family type IVb pilin [Acidobacteriota bacterium]